MNDWYIGLDIGGTKCAVVLGYVDRGVHIHDKMRFETQASRSFEAVFEQLCETINTIIARNGLNNGQIRAIGVSCGGPLDSRNGVVLCPPNLPGWVNIPLTKLLHERFSIPAYLQNDANACALVEWKLGAGRGSENMIFLTMGTGMGAGVVCEGRLLCGNTDMGGEVGHIRLTEDGPVGYGKAGSFEGYTSGGGIGRQAVQLTEELNAAGKTPAWVRNGETEIDARLMADYARRGDEDALSLWNQVGRMLGRGLSVLADAFNPERIVIGSVFVRCEDLLRPSMEAEMQKEALPHALNGLSIVPAQAGEALGDLASIMVALYALGVDPMKDAAEREPRVLAHYERLFERYPALSCCRDSVMQAYLMLLECYQNGGKLLITGNGGSCADSEHIVGELMKGFYLKRPLAEDLQERIKANTETLLPGTASVLQQGLPAIALTGHAPLSTATQNDVHPSLSAAQQVVGYGRPGDVLIGISTSGGAMNVALTAGVARAMGMKTIALTGGSGGRLAKLCDCAIIAPASTPADVQEYHLPIYHTLCAMIEAKLFES